MFMYILLYLCYVVLCFYLMFKLFKFIEIRIRKKDLYRQKKINYLARISNSLDDLVDFLGDDLCWIFY